MSKFGTLVGVEDKRITISNKYQAVYTAKVLGGRDSLGELGNLTPVLFDANVELLPHQVRAAVFGTSGLQEALLCCEEVGLGKTVIAGLVLCEKMARGASRVLIVCPANLRQQWKNELWDKFGLESRVVDSGKLKVDSDELTDRQDKDVSDNYQLSTSNYPLITIVSYQMAHLKAKELAAQHWDIAVFDEAHRLRNFYKDDVVIAKSLYELTAGAFKILLTATPLHNSLLELYGLVSFAYPDFFGSLETFRNRYITNASGERMAELAERLKFIMTRTLRQSVKEYIKFTNRVSTEVGYTWSEAENNLHTALIQFIASECKCFGGYRGLFGALLLKRLSSSRAAFESSLAHIVATIRKALGGRAIEYDVEDEESGEMVSARFSYPASAIPKVKEELQMLEAILEQSQSIKLDTKITKLQGTITEALSKSKQLGENQKVIIFTESVVTAEHIFAHLKKPFKALLMTGDTLDKDKVRAEFRKPSSQVLVSTEVGAEGLNLQFCSNIINYDLPYNPQRIEQRIGRCHRYGQKFDVTVFNFVNYSSYIDKRVYSILSEKFGLFDGIFGSSDGVIGTLENIGFERRLTDIYVNCRTQKEIDEAFDALQKEYAAEIKAGRDTAKQLALDSLDEDVTAKLKLIDSESKVALNRVETLLWELAKYKLKNCASINEETKTIVTGSGKFNDVKLELSYHMNRDDSLYNRLRFQNRLVKEILFDCFYEKDYNSETEKEFTVSRRFDKNSLVFYLDNRNIAALQNLKGNSGLLAFCTIQDDEYFGSSYPIIVGLTDAGEVLDGKTAEKLLFLRAEEQDRGYIPQEEKDAMAKLVAAEAEKIKAKINARYQEIFNKQRAIVAGSFKDKKDKLASTIKDLEKKLKEAKAALKTCSNLTEQSLLKNKIADITLRLSLKKQQIIDDTEELTEAEEKQVAQLRGKTLASPYTKEIFLVKWELR